jgi:CHASE2 domain-containing sensor protein
MIRHARIRHWLLAPLVMALAFGLGQLPVFQRLELQWLDLSFKIIRTLVDPRQNNDVVIIGFDEKSLTTFGKPFALLHDEYSAVLNALLLAKPRAVAVDLILPKQEYSSLIPGGLQRLGASIYHLRSEIPLFIGTQPIPPQTSAEQIYAAMAGVNGQVLLSVPEDFDGVLRRVDNKLSSNSAKMPILAASVVHSLGENAANGIVDFTLGEPFSYVPAALVVDMLRNKDMRNLSAQFRDKIVLVGAVLPDQDRQSLPLASHFSSTGYSQHAQAKDDQ